MNRDTLYSFAIVDISAGATLTLPDAGSRYLSAMIINQDHYINRVFHDPGSYELTTAEFGSPFVAVGVRILADPGDEADVAAVNALQDEVTLTSKSSRPFPMPDYEAESFTKTRNLLLELARGMTDFSRAFGSRDEVDQVEHLIGTAAGWGGLPNTEATYIGIDPGLPIGEYQITVGDVPVDAFWSISVYNAQGFFDPAPKHLNSVNSITGIPNADGTITVNFGVSDEDKPNYLSIMEGWNYLVRLYRPRPEVLDGTFTFPGIEPA